MNKKKIRLYSSSEEFIPYYASLKAAGADLRAAIEEPKEMLPGHSLAVPTGVFLEIPDGFEVQIRPRSGLAFKHQITVLNTPGTIDADYRGEIKVILINHSTQAFSILPGMRIAQMVLTPVFQADFELVDSKESLSSSKRGEKGFGHTGLLETTLQK